MTTLAENVSGSESGGMLHPYQFTIKKLIVHTSDGLALDISRNYYDINLFEDIFSPCMTGSIRVTDGNDLISKFYFHGNEFLEIEIDKPSLETPIKKVFRIYKVSDRDFSSSTTHSAYTIYFCSEEMILSTTFQFSKAYRGARIDQIIRNILKDELQVLDTKIDGQFSKTDGMFDIIVPKMTPLEAIKWLSTRAYSDQGTLYFFYETINGFTFVSYEDLLSLPVYGTYGREEKITNQASVNMNTFTFLKVIEDFDIMKASRYGALSSGLLTLDLVKKKYIGNKFSAIDYKENGILNKQVTVNDSLNRFGSNFYNSPTGMMKYTITSDSDETRNPVSPEKWLSRSASKLGQLHLFKMVGTIPGDIVIKAGRTIEVSFPEYVPLDDTRPIQENPMRNGRYLVSAVHHHFIGDYHTTTLELLSDSIANDLPSPSNSSPKYREMITS